MACSYTYPFLKKAEYIIITQYMVTYPNVYFPLLANQKPTKPHKSKSWGLSWSGERT